MKVKVTLIKCDRCHATIEQPEELHRVRVSQGQKARIVKDACIKCAEGATAYMQGANLARMGRPSKDAPAETPELVKAKTIVNEALERYADGASADVLAGYLRDVASAANRQPVGRRR